MPNLREKFSGYFGSKRNKQNNGQQTAPVIEISSPTFVYTTSKQARELYAATSNPPTPTTTEYSPYGSGSNTPSTPSTPYASSFFDYYPGATASQTNLAKNGNTTRASNQHPQAGGRITSNKELDKQYNEAKAAKHASEFF